MQGRPLSKGSSSLGIANEAANKIQTSRRTDMSGMALLPPHVAEHQVQACNAQNISSALRDIGQ
jgi:hypothetical protein